MIEPNVASERLFQRAVWLVRVQHSGAPRNFRARNADSHGATECLVLRSPPLALTSLSRFSNPPRSPMTRRRRVFEMPILGVASPGDIDTAMRTGGGA